MKVILQSDIGKIGKKYDIVDVSDGYGRNYLIPRGLAELGTVERIALHERDRASYEAAEQERTEALRSKLSELVEEGVSVTASANDQGHLFAGLHASEIAERIGNAAGVSLSQDSIKMDDIIKEVGKHDIEVRVGDEYITVPLTITGEES